MATKVGESKSDSSGGSIKDTYGQTQEMRKVEEEMRRVQTSIDIDPVIHKRLNRKFDMHVVPFIFGIWLLAFIDRSNIGNAKISGLPQELGIATGNGFNIALLVFYIPYILVDVPSNWIIKRVRAGIYLPALITTWGLVCTFLGFTKSFAGLIVGRLFLGALEGGLLGGIIVYLGMFYRRHELLWRMGVFYCAAPLSGAFGGLLASGLSNIQKGGYDKWPWIFFIEGAITVLFGISCFFFLPHDPEHAKFLTEEERDVALTRLRVDLHGATAAATVDQEHFSWHWVRMAMLAPQSWFGGVIFFFILIPLYSFSLFLPTIVTGLGFKVTTTAQLVTVPPNMLAFFVVLGMAFLSDKFRSRGPMMIPGLLVAIVGYIMLLAAREANVRYGGTFLVGAGIFYCSPITMGWLSNNLAPHYVRATGIGFMIALGNCAAFPATLIYQAADGPDYVKGHSVALGACVLCLFTVLVQDAYLYLENKKRDRGMRDSRLGEKDVALLGHRHPAFRYTL